MSKTRYSIYLSAYGEGGFNSDSVETKAVFTKAQAEALESLLKFIGDNAGKPYWTVDSTAEVVGE